MEYSNDDIRELYRKIATIVKYDDKGIASLKDLQKEPKWKEVNFQDKCEGDNLLGDLLLKHATENNNPRVKDLFLRNGFKIPQQEQITTEVNEEREPDVEENGAGSNAADSNNSRGSQFATSYNKIKEIVTNNPSITAQEFGEKLKKEEIDIKITNQDGWTLLYYAVRSEGPSITGDRSIFLRVVGLLTNSDIKVNGIQDTAYTLLDHAAIKKQADVVKILLNSGKFNEEEKFNALRLAIVQGNVQEFEAFLGYVNAESRRAALELAMNTTQKEITQVLLNFITPETSDVEENGNRAGPSSSNGNIGSRPVNTPNGQLNHNNENKTPVSTRTDQTATPNNDNKANGFLDAQFSVPNEKETKYKKNFYTSLTKDVVGVVVTGLFIAAAVMVPSVAGAVVCGVIAALVATYIGLHVKNSTLPSYREMEKNKVEHVSSKTAQTLRFEKNLH
ncbi:ankyrin repeat domain-containing protein [Wolbachia endosymbiont (group A) of Rhinocyllus conicus]|uniref:ankyrin repeat domain-containing protein n=1 Tax=Wolbachia endosymbiont (group A) of Rhinocyllus conicus TaxID=2954053 RepID=UPI0022260E71|nr:ankyrin repeat domain-containing protein [Wolbachia endosymbiont (group A) of Rhinocyllus conicus]